MRKPKKQAPGRFLNHPPSGRGINVFLHHAFPPKHSGIEGSDRMWIVIDLQAICNRFADIRWFANSRHRPAVWLGAPSGLDQYMTSRGFRSQGVDLSPSGCATEDNCAHVPHAVVCEKTKLNLGAVLFGNVAQTHIWRPVWKLLGVGGIRRFVNVNVIEDGTDRPVVLMVEERLFKRSNCQNEGPTFRVLQSSVVAFVLAVLGEY